MGSGEFKVPEAAVEEWLNLGNEPLMPDLAGIGCTAFQVGLPVARPVGSELLFPDLLAKRDIHSSTSATSCPPPLGQEIPPSAVEIEPAEMQALLSQASPQGYTRPGLFIRAPTTSLDNFLADAECLDAARTCSLPARGNSWTPPAQQPAGVLTSRLLQAMPMGRTASGPLGAGSARKKDAEQKAVCPVDQESEAAHRLKNRDAQRRFRQRQRESINSAQKAVEELTRKLQDLAWDVQQERVNARVIMESLFLEDIHIKRLATLPAVRSAEQETMINCFQNVIYKMGRTDDVRQWRVRDWIDWFGKDYIPRLKDLLSKQQRNPAAASLLRELVTMRRENLARVARFSSWAWVLYAWNLEACKTVPACQRPGLEQCARLLGALRLTRAQEDKLLKAHTRLRQQLTIALIERHRVVAALERSEEGSAPAAEAAASESWSRGTPTGGRDSKEELAQADSLGSAASTGSQESGRTHYGGFQVEGVDWGPAGPALRSLRRYLEGERWAVFNFLFTVLDETLTPEQEAVVETVAYPFQADWHTTLCVLSLQRQKKPVTLDAVRAMALPDLAVSSPVARSLMPTASATTVLLQPLTVLGMGNRLAYGIALNPYQTVDDSSLWRLPPSEHTSGMRIQDAVSGSWQIGVGAPLYWFGLSAEDQDPYSLEPGDKDRLRKKLQQKLGLLRL